MVESTTISILMGKFIIGMLIFIRILAFFTAAPFFKSMAIPNQMKVWIGFIFAISITEFYWQQQPPVDLHLWSLVFIVMKEVMAGLAIGFAANAVFWGVRMAGGIIDFDMGYHTQQIFNLDETSPTIVGELKYQMTLLLFLAINGHHFLLQAIYSSFKLIPITEFSVTETTVSLMVKLATTVLIVGVKVSAPVLIAIFLTNMALALLARVAPQTNIFILSFQVKITVGLLVLIASAPLAGLIIKYLLGSSENDVMQFIMSLNPLNV